MELVFVVDTNEVFSAIIAKGRGLQTKKLDILFSDKIALFAPDFLFKELRKTKNLNDLKSKSGFSDNDIEVFIKILELRIKKVSDKDLAEKFAEAESISTHSKDTLYFAAALKLNCPIWSGEKRLKNQSSVKVFNTKDLVKEYEL